ncbi:DUF3375 domain-containing protein [Microbacteriaceae bacterium VKM Ac-2854]|nr:DUF3375 domain-containing protein [Microbacteriaceae bacterium VKM Ac-2854]
MSTLSDALALRRLRDDSAAWSLLRAENAPIAAAILDRHLGAEQRRLPVPELIDRVDAELDLLRDHGFELPRTAQAYCADWRALGILVRRPSETTRSETFELSPDALTAIRFLTQLATPQQSVTESRLATIAERLAALARETDPDSSSRLAQLQAQRDRIDAEIAAVQGGTIDVLSDAQAAERARDVLALAESIPTDFARVRVEIERINRELRERIVDSEEAQSHVLDEIFRGVDLLADSEAGRSFAGFYALILDPETNAAFDESVDRVLDRGFARELTAQQRRTLRRLIRTMQEGSAEIHEVMTTFARGLRRFVQSQEYQQDRAIKRMLREALADALPLAQRVKPYRATRIELALTSVALDSVGRLALYNPADLETAVEVTTRADEPVDLAELRELARETEIDLVELTANVNSAIAVRGRSTVGEVLELHPATQGVASVVGLLVLAEKHGVTDAGTERIRWHQLSGAPRAATIERRAFTGRIE